MEEEVSGEEERDVVGELREFLEAQLDALEDPRNVHQVRERLFGKKWAEPFDREALPEGVFEKVAADVDRAWGALSRYPWDLYGAQQALKASVESTEQ
jgi:hypothetical protein